VATVPFPVLAGDATDDTILAEAGIDRARTLIAALDTDAGNVYVTLSARALRPDLFIVARARIDSAVDRLQQAGADRVVNPQQIGGARMAAFALQPHVAEFLDIVMHDGSLEFRLEEVVIPPGSAAAGRSLRDAHLRDRTGALVLAMRDEAGNFNTNPAPDTVIEPGQVLIAIGTTAQLATLSDAVRRGSHALDG
jgi:voltage-gated potassium channel